MINGLIGFFFAAAVLFNLAIEYLRMRPDALGAHGMTIVAGGSLASIIAIIVMIVLKFYLAEHPPQASDKPPSALRRILSVGVPAMLIGATAGAALIGFVLAGSWALGLTLSAEAASTSLIFAVILAVSATITFVVTASTVPSNPQAERK